MIIEEFSALLQRDLKTLRQEILQYKNEPDLWKIKGEIANPAGNLVLHLCGNLNHFIGAVLGSTGYLRERDKEFSEKNTDRKKLVLLIDDTIAMVAKALAPLSDTILATTYPLAKHEENVTTLHMLLHLFGHFSYHLGQVNYHRRLCNG